MFISSAPNRFLNLSFRHWASIACVLFGCGLAGLSVWISADAIIDDALISLRYARNFIDGHGLVFNPGDLVEGYTNLGHVLGVIALNALGVDLVVAARVLGLAGGVAAVYFGPAAILPDPEGQRLERGVARLLLLANFYFVYMCYSGLETGLYTGVLCLTAWVFKRAGDRISVATGFLVGLLFLIRPDGALFAPAFFGLAWLSGGLRRVVLAPGVWLWGAMFVAIEGWRYWYYGELVPNTARIKGVAFAFDWETWTWGGRGLPWYGLIGDDVVELLNYSGGAACLIFAFLAVIRYEAKDRVALAAVMCVTVLVFVFYSGGDWMLGYRFLQPLLPFYLTLVAIGITDALRMLQGDPPQAWVRGAWVTSLAAMSAVSTSAGIEFHFHDVDYPNTHMTSRYMVPASRWLAEHYPKHYQVTAASVGALGYYGDFVVVDTIGLTNLAIARLRGNREGKAAYIESLNPELVLLNEKPDAPREREIYGREYRLDRAFVRGDEPRWLLYVRADLPLRPGRPLP
jgi:hypothetical protein